MSDSLDKNLWLPSTRQLHELDEDMACDFLCQESGLGGSMLHTYERATTPPISIIINQLVKTYHCFWSQYICLPSSYYSFLFLFSWKSLPRILVPTNSEDKRDQRWHALWVWKIIRIPTLQPTKKSLYPTNKLLTCKSAWVKLGEH